MLKALLSNKEKLQELANIPLNENCSTVILKKLPKKLGDPGKFLIMCGFSELKCKALVDLADFVIVDYESDPRVPLILGTPFLRTARALIDVHGEEMILRDDDERLTLNMRHDTSSYSNQPQKDSINLINDSINQSNLADLNNNLVDSMPEMFTDEHALDYSSPSLFDEYNDDLFEVKSDTENVYDDPFDSKGEKIKESKILIDELDLTCDFLPPFEYDSFISEDFSRVDAFPLTNNEDKLLDSVGCQKPGHLAVRLGCAETKVVTWDDLAFKLITLGWNVKHKNFAKSLIQR
nr:hypothetical protein [Tanacetum cinerariifolium]